LGKDCHTWNAKSISSVVKTTSSSNDNTASVLINGNGSNLLQPFPDDTNICRPAIFW